MQQLPSFNATSAFDTNKRMRTMGSGDLSYHPLLTPQPQTNSAMTVNWMNSLNWTLLMNSMSMNMNYANYIPLNVINLSSFGSSPTNPSGIFGSTMSNLDTLLADKSLPESNIDRKRKRSEELDPEDAEVVLMSGQWTSNEETILLHLTIGLVNCELKVISLACQKCGVLRGPRAIDKKLKRLIGFSSWKNRDVNQILAKAKGLIESKVGYEIDRRKQEMIDGVVKVVLKDGSC